MLYCQCMPDEMNAEEEEYVPRGGRGSSTPRVLLPVLAVFACLLCYVAVTVVRNGASQSPEQVRIAQLTATVQNRSEAAAGETVIAEMQAEATATARVGDVMTPTRINIAATANPVPPSATPGPIATPPAGGGVPTTPSPARPDSSP